MSSHFFQLPYFFMFLLMNIKCSSHDIFSKIYLFVKGTCSIIDINGLTINMKEHFFCLLPCYIRYSWELGGFENVWENLQISPLFCKYFIIFHFAIKSVINSTGITKKMKKHFVLFCVCMYRYMRTNKLSPDLKD